MVYADADAIAVAGQRQGLNSATALKGKFGGAHESWQKLLTWCPVQRKVFDFACGKLGLDPREVEVFPLIGGADAQRGLKVVVSHPTVLDFRSQYDARPSAAWPGGRGKATVEDQNNRLFLLFSYLELHAADKETDIFIESVRMRVKVGNLRQTFHPYRWCNISGANNSRTNPRGYWLAERDQPPTGVAKGDQSAKELKEDFSHLRKHGPEGFHIGRHGPLSIKEECSFVALKEGDLRLYRDLLDFLADAGVKGQVECKLTISFRYGDEQKLRVADAELSAPLEHLQKSKEAYERKHGYAASLPAYINF